MSIQVERIKNAVAVTSVFGQWPSFHDAEVLRIELSRTSNSLPGPTVIADIHVFSMSRKVDDQGFFVCENHSTVTLRFVGISDLDLDGFNHQNVLSGLEITHLEAEASFEVRFDPTYGVGSHFKCQLIEVVSITPGIPPESVYARAKV